MWRLHRDFKIKKNVPNDGIVVFKIPYAPWLRVLNIRRAFDSLVKALQQSHEKGADEFLHDVRLIVAHKAMSSIFLDSYKFNYVHDSEQLRSQASQGFQRVQELGGQTL